jgi:hypothetical protein
VGKEIDCLTVGGEAKIGSGINFLGRDRLTFFTFCTAKNYY